MSAQEKQANSMITTAKSINIIEYTNFKRIFYLNIWFPSARADTNKYK